jgi:hypothetical protein
MQETEIVADFDRIPESTTSHFFVGVDESDPTTTSKIATFDSCESDPHSIMQFLQLPTVTTRVNSTRKDPIIDYTKSIILSSSQYIEASTHIRCCKENAMREKATPKERKEEIKRKKAVDREADTTRQAAEREESARQRDQRLAEKVVAQGTPHGGGYAS